MSQPTITIVGSFAVGMTLRTTHMPIFGETLRGSDFDMGPGGERVESGGWGGSFGGREPLCRDHW